MKNIKEKIQDLQLDANSIIFKLRENPEYSEYGVFLITCDKSKYTYCGNFDFGQLEITLAMMAVSDKNLLRTLVNAVVIAKQNNSANSPLVKEMKKRGMKVNL